jgi:hypothetical protein
MTYLRMSSDAPNSTDIYAGRFTCNGFTFLLTLSPINHSNEIAFATHGGVTVDAIRPMYHPRRLIIENSKSFVAFSWNERN